MVHHDANTSHLPALGKCGACKDATICVRVDSQKELLAKRRKGLQNYLLRAKPLQLIMTLIHL